MTKVTVLNCSYIRNLMKTRNTPKITDLLLCGSMTVASMGAAALRMVITPVTAEDASFFTGNSPTILSESVCVTNEDKIIGGLIRLGNLQTYLNMQAAPACTKPPLLHAFL